MTAVSKVFEDDNLRGKILGHYINQRRAQHMYQKQKEEYDAIVGCISFCAVQYHIENHDYDLDDLCLWTIPLRWRHREVGPGPSWPNTEVAMFLNLRETEIYIGDYDVSWFKREWGKNWRRKHWYREVYRGMFMEHLEFDDLIDMYLDDYLDDSDQLNLHERYD